MGKDNFIKKRMTVILSEQRHVFIGDQGMFSVGIWIRNADPHLIMIVILENGKIQPKVYM